MRETSERRGRRGRREKGGRGGGGERGGEERKERKRGERERGGRGGEEEAIPVHRLRRRRPWVRCACPTTGTRRLSPPKAPACPRPYPGGRPPCTRTPTQGTACHCKTKAEATTVCGHPSTVFHCLQKVEDTTPSQQQGLTAEAASLWHACRRCDALYRHAEFCNLL